MHITKEFKYSDFRLLLQSRGIDRYSYEEPELYKQLKKYMIIENLDTLVSYAGLNFRINENLETVNITLWFE